MLCFWFRGFPVWLKYVPGIEFRTDNGPFKVGNPLGIYRYDFEDLFFPQISLNLALRLMRWGIKCVLFLFSTTSMKAAMQKFTEKIVGMMKSEKLFENQGGPIILSQVGISPLDFHSRKMGYIYFIAFDSILSSIGPLLNTSS